MKCADEDWVDWVAYPTRIRTPIATVRHFTLQWRGGGSDAVFLAIGDVCRGPITRADLQGLLDAWPDGAE